MDRNKVSSEENLKNPNKRRAGFVVSAAVLGNLVLAACTPNASAHEVPKPEVTHSASPSETTTPTPEVTQDPDRYENSDFTQTEPLPVELEYLETATPEEFAQAPKAEQLKWLSWATQYKDEFVARFNEINSQVGNEPYTLTPDSDPMTIYKESQATDRLAASLGVGEKLDRNDNGSLDTDMISKIYISHSIMNNIGYGDQFIANLENFSDGRALNVVNLSRKNAFNGVAAAQEASDLTTFSMELISPVTGDLIPAYSINFTDPETGREHTGVMGVIEFENFKGEIEYTYITNL